MQNRNTDTDCSRNNGFTYYIVGMTSVRIYAIILYRSLIYIIIKTVFADSKSKFKIRFRIEVPIICIYIF